MPDSDDLQRHDAYECENEESLPFDALFKEPNDEKVQENPFTYYRFESSGDSHAIGSQIRAIEVRLVGQSPLWGHLIWNSSIELCRFLERQCSSYISSDTSVLELGAGAGLPSLLCAKLGAKRVVATDYPDSDLLDNLRWNVDKFEETIAIQKADETSKSNVLVVQGFIWGGDQQRLLQHVLDTKAARPTEPKFDIIIASDLLFNHSEHEKLASTIRSCLSRNASARALIFFAPHRPWLFERDLSFFKAIGARFRGASPQLAAQKRDEQTTLMGSSSQDTSATLLQDLESLPADEGGANVKSTTQLNFELVFRQTFDQGMFEDEATRQKDRDERDSRLRRTVFGFAAWWDSPAA